MSGRYSWAGGWQDGAGETVFNGGVDITTLFHSLRERTLTINADSTWTGGQVNLYLGAVIDNQADFNIQTDADMVLQQAPNSKINNYGTLRKTVSGDGNGSTNINADFINSGSLSVGSGSVGFQQTFTQSSTGTLFVDIAGSANGTFDIFAISKGATLDGTLDINLLGGYQPDSPTTFEIMTFSSRSGTFATIVDQSIGNGKEFQANYGATDVTLEIVTP